LKEIHRFIEAFKTQQGSLSEENQAKFPHSFIENLMFRTDETANDNAVREAFVVVLSKRSWKNQDFVCNVFFVQFGYVPESGVTDAIYQMWGVQELDNLDECLEKYITEKLYHR
jgi:hypothetical protein